MHSRESTLTEDARRFARTALAKEREERRQKLWSIFSWAGTTLVAMIGGTVALSANKDFSIQFSHRLMLSFAVAILSAYSAWWIKRNLDLEEAADSALKTHDQALHIDPIETRWPNWLGYNPTLFLLFVAAETTIWVLPP